MAYYERRVHVGGGLLPPVIQNLLIANGVLFALQMFFPGGYNSIGILERWLALWPIGAGNWFERVGWAQFAGIDFYPWQLLTYGFLHGNFTHILLNMLALWMFGRDIELYWGGKRFLTYYLVCVVGAGLIQLLVTSLSLANGASMPYPTIGASGGTFGILLGFGMMFPRRIVQMIFPPIAMEARWFVMLFGAIELFFGVTGMRTGVAHFAHLGGMLFGLLLILYWRGKLPIKPSSRMIW